MIHGLASLNARLDAIGESGGTVSRRWSADMARRARFNAPVKTGRTRASVRVTTVSDDRAEVTASGGGVFVQTGTRAHDIRPKGNALKFSKGRTIFAPKVHQPRQPAKPWFSEAGSESLEALPLADIVTDRWNGAA